MGQEQAREDGDERSSASSLRPTAAPDHKTPVRPQPHTGRGSKRQSVAETIARFSPRSLPPSAWARIEAPARQWVSHAALTDTREAVVVMSVVSQLLVWADGHGEPLEPEVLLHPETIDRFLAEGCGHLKVGTRATYRTHLRRIGRALIGPELFPPKTIPIPAQEPLAPYRPEEIAAQLAWVHGLPSAHMAANAEILLALGVGAGLDATEMARVRGSEISRDPDGVVVEVTARHRRIVPVLASWEELIFRRARQVGERYCFRPERTAVIRHQTSNFIARCAKAAGAPPALSLQRLRTTWLVTQLVAGTPPNELARLSGIQAVQLAKYFDLLPDADPTSLRAQVRDAEQP